MYIMYIFGQAAWACATFPLSNCFRKAGVRGCSAKQILEVAKHDQTCGCFAWNEFGVQKVTVDIC